MQRLFQGGISGLTGLLQMPATINKMMIAIVAMGGITIMLIGGGMAWGFGSGRQDIGKTVTAVGQGVATVAKTAAVAI